MLVARRKDSSEGKQPVSDIKKMRHEDLRDIYVDDLKLAGKTSLYSRTNEKGETVHTFRGLDHFNKFFRGATASQITTDKIRQYIRWRQKEGDADPTIRRQLVHLAPYSSWRIKNKSSSRCRTSRCPRTARLPDSILTRPSSPSCSSTFRQSSTRSLSSSTTRVVESGRRSRSLGRWSVQMPALSRSQPRL
jgi:hypothetical protein